LLVVTAVAMGTNKYFRASELRGGEEGGRGVLKNF